MSILNTVLIALLAVAGLVVAIAGAGIYLGRRAQGSTQKKVKPRHRAGEPAAKKRRASSTKAPTPKVSSRRRAAPKRGRGIKQRGKKRYPICALSGETLHWNDIESHFENLPQTDAELVLIDGTNILRQDPGDDRPRDQDGGPVASLEFLYYVLEALINRGLTPWCFFDASTRHKFPGDKDGEEAAQYNELLQEFNHVFIEAPKGVSADRLLLQAADKSKSVILSEDYFDKPDDFKVSWIKTDHDQRNRSYSPRHIVLKIEPAKRGYALTLTPQSKAKKLYPKTHTIIIDKHDDRRGDTYKKILVMMIRH